MDPMWLDTHAIGALMGLKSATVARSWRMWHDGHGFPAPISGAGSAFGGRGPSRWRAKDVRAWLELPRIYQCPPAIANDSPPQRLTKRPPPPKPTGHISALIEAAS